MIGYLLDIDSIYSAEKMKITEVTGNFESIEEGRYITYKVMNLVLREGFLFKSKEAAVSFSIKKVTELIREENQSHRDKVKRLTEFKNNLLEEKLG